MHSTHHHACLSRRRFLGQVSAAAAGAVAGAGVTDSRAFAEAGVLDASAIVRRRLGRTDFQMSHIAAAWDWNEEVLYAALDLGVNYLHKINWLPKVPEPLKALDREAWYCDATIDTFDEDGIVAQFEHALKTLGLEYIDAMKLHSIYKTADQVRQKTGVFKAFDRLKKAGKVRHLACAQHGGELAAICMACIESGNFDHLQPVLGVVQTPEQRQVIEAAAKNDVGIITKKTMHAVNVVNGTFKPRNAQQVQRQKDIRAAVAPNLVPGGKVGAAVIKTMLKLPGVTAVTPLTQNFAQLEDNLTNGGVKLTRHEEDLVRHVRVACADRCVYCGACNQVCPQRLPISDMLRYAAYHTLYGEPQRARSAYASLPAESRVSACQNCGSCERKCPLGVPVRQRLSEAHALLA